MTINEEQKAFYIRLPGRGLIQIEGPDRLNFLQRLITNDIRKLEKQSAIYACLLTPQGKFLHDFFVSIGPKVLLLECEGGERAHDLYERLKKYQLRAKVRISVQPDFPVFICFGAQPDPGFTDPRHEELGWRGYMHPENAEERSYNWWDGKRIRLGIPDGSRDAELEKSTLEELNIDKFNGVSYEKGCYVGQELTARMHHRGLGKKHLLAVQGDNLPANGESILIDNVQIGIMRSSCDSVGLALIRDDLRGSLANDAAIHLLG